MASGLVVFELNATAIFFVVTSQTAEETPVTDLAAFSIRSLHCSQLPETLNRLLVRALLVRAPLEVGLSLVEVVRAPPLVRAPLQVELSLGKL